MRTRCRCIGFTLIELLIVVAILSLLAALLLPALRRSIDQARLTACMNNHRQIYLGAGMYASDARGFLPAWPPGWGDGWMNKALAKHSSFPVNEFGQKTQPGWGGRLVLQGYIDAPALLVCPDTEATERSSMHYSQNMLLNVPADQWLSSSTGWGAWTNYVQASRGKLSRYRGVLYAAAVNAFGYPMKYNPPGHPHGRITRMHGVWPDNPKDYDTFHAVGLGVMNMTLHDGSTHAVRDWADERKYPWHLRDYYWPCNDRTGWGFWTVFREALP